MSRVLTARLSSTIRQIRLNFQGRVWSCALGMMAALGSARAGAQLNVPPIPIPAPAERGTEAPAATGQEPLQAPLQAPIQSPVPAAGTAQVLPPAPSNRLPTVHARAASGPITIDGKLDEPAWQGAETILLTQQSPRPGGPTPYKTEVRVLIYHDALIFGFICHDPDPKRIQTHTLTRDGDQSGDDTVTLLLDTFGDKRTGYDFQINSSGARLDGLVAGPNSVSTDWDGIWDARTARTEDGWSAEIWIPAQTLTFAGGNNHWGLEIDRSIVRDQTDMRWASPLLDANLFDMSRAGNLEIGARLNQGHGIELAPYLSGRMLRNSTVPSRNWLSEEGGELTWRITPQLAAILTVNTDFAETEVDSHQINVTPFPLYFPEKRSFFLEGANQYVFGLDLDFDYTFIPFFSRNVGLLDGYDVPIDGGLKIDGHIGPWSLALLDVETRKTWVPQTVVDYLGLPSPEVEGTNLLASRVAYDVDQHLRVGTILTHGDPEAQLENLLVGADADWHTSNFLGRHALQFGGWAATTQGQVPDGSRQAWGVQFDYPNDLVYCSAGMKHFGEGFEPLLGFLPRPSTHQIKAYCKYGPRPSPNGRFREIRQAFYDISFNRITDTIGNLQSQSIVFVPLNLADNQGDQLQASIDVHNETLTTPFAVVPTVTYPVGSFNYERYLVSLTTAPQRLFQFTNQSAWGGYYNGRLWEQTNGLSWNPFHGRLETQAVADNYFGHTPQGNYVQKLWQFKGAFSWNPNLSLSTFVQFDNVSNDLTSNTRLLWTFKPGDTFYVIWDRDWQRNPARPGISLLPEDESITAKIQWTFRL